MKLLVTGAAGFVGSHLCERLLDDGYDVVGVDSFATYYPRRCKEDNLAGLLGRPRFRLVEADLNDLDLPRLLRDVGGVFHLAAMPGLVKSWSDFDAYNLANVTATYRLLEAAAACGPRLARFVHASTSSVYGRFAEGDELQPVRPISPYGVTKHTAENLCRTFHEEHGVPAVVLRFFSVYGPRQRPDMAYNRFIRAALRHEPIEVYGDGQQSRSNTYVGDCVAAAARALELPAGEVFNLGGAEPVTVNEVLAHVERLAGRTLRIVHGPRKPGDQRATRADTSKLRAALGWQPRVGIEEGLERQFQWQKAAAGATALAA
jgi:nucleoside-diphosphate-sugar epimerase